MKIKTEPMKAVNQYQPTIHIGEHGRGHYTKTLPCLNCHDDTIASIQRGLSLETVKNNAICPTCGCSFDGKDVIEEKK